MAKPFRKLEVLLNGTVYILDRAEAEMLLAQFDASDAVVGETARMWREDLRSALETETDETVTENPFADESGEPPVPWEKPDAQRPTPDARVGGDVATETAPVCLFCGKPGVASGSPVFDLWRCQNKDCFRSSGGNFTRSVFAEGVQ